MKGALPDDEFEALPAGSEVEAIIPLAVPGLDAERHLIILKAGS
jgi:16S rRNA (guanine527-N7)-methyltransferase